MRDLFSALSILNNLQANDPGRAPGGLADSSFTVKPRGESGLIDFCFRLNQRGGVLALYGFSSLRPSPFKGISVLVSYFRRL